MYKIVYLILSSFLLLIGCRNSNYNKPDRSLKTFEIEIPELKNSNSPVIFSEIFNQVDYIKLETNNNILLNGETIQKIKEYNGFVYLLDMNVHSGLNAGLGNIYCFNKNGAFFNIIGVKGKGPGEYLNAYNFDIRDSELYISDFTSGKIVFYSLTNNFIKEIKPDFNFNSFNKLDANSYFFWINNFDKKANSKGNEIIMCDSKLNKIVGVLDEDRNTISITPTSFIVFDSLLYFNRYYSNKIYSFDRNGNVSEACILKFSLKNQIPEELMKEEVSKIEAERKQMDYAKIFKYYILKDYLFFKIIAKDKYNLLYSKRSGKIKLINDKQFINDVNETGNVINISGVVTDQNVLIGSVSALDIINNIDNVDTKITELSKNMREDDNPVIVYYKIKDF